MDMSIRTKRRRILTRREDMLNSITLDSSVTNEENDVNAIMDDEVSRAQFESSPYESSPTDAIINFDDASEVIADPETDDSTETSNSSSLQCEKNIVDDIKTFAIETNQTQSAMKYLLRLLSKYHPELPLDPRTLLEKKAQPRNHQLRQVHPGVYHHFGVFNGLKEIVSVSTVASDRINLSLNVDGSEQQIGPMVDLR